MYSNLPDGLEEVSGFGMASHLSVLAAVHTPVKPDKVTAIAATATRRLCARRLFNKGVWIDNIGVMEGPVRGSMTPRLCGLLIQRKKASYPVLRISALTTKINTQRTNPVPCFRAMRVPKMLPTTFATASTTA